MNKRILLSLTFAVCINADLVFEAGQRRPPQSASRFVEILESPQILAMSIWPGHDGAHAVDYTLFSIIVDSLILLLVWSGAAKIAYRLRNRET